MSTGLKIAIGAFISFIIVVGLSIAWLFSVKFEAGRMDNEIVASNQNLENVHSSVQKILQTSGITVKNFGEVKVKAIEAAVARYADKPQLMMQWVQENPQQIPDNLWSKFQDQVERQYQKFETEQKFKISKSQAYKDYLQNTVRGNVAQYVWSYPRPETAKIMDQVIKTEETATTFKTGIDKPVNPF